MSALKDMRDRLNQITDPELLEVAKEVLFEMSEIQNLKEQLEMREAKLLEGRRAAFYFFAADLDKEELDHAVSTVTGRVRFLKDKKERESYGLTEVNKISETETKSNERSEILGQEL